MTGYGHQGYVESMAEFGQPLKLPTSGGWLLSRSIPGTTDRDAMGCYPLFCCSDWRCLRQDLDACRDRLLTVALVADPFGNFDESLLRTSFDRVFPFKTHYVVDLNKPLESYTSARHRKFARQALRRASIDVCSDPIAHLDDWIELYGHLMARHGISGIRAFSRQSFARQLVVPGMIMFRATAYSQVVALNLWYVQGDVAQAHLAAASPLGYDLHATYALKLAIIEFFKGKVRWLNLGGSPGLDDRARDGLAAFKRGWASDTRIAWFCGRILQPDRYREILRQRHLKDDGYFPAYRQGEYD